MKQEGGGQPAPASARGDRTTQPASTATGAVDAHVYATGDQTMREAVAGHAPGGSSGGAAAAAATAGSSGAAVAGAGAGVPAAMADDDDDPRPWLLFDLNGALTGRVARCFCYAALGCAADSLGAAKYLALCRCRTRCVVHGRVPNMPCAHVMYMDSNPVHAVQTTTHLRRRACGGVQVRGTRDGTRGRRRRRRRPGLGRPRRLLTLQAPKLPGSAWGGRAAGAAA